MVPAVSSSFHWPISAGRASPETGSSWYPPLYFNRPIVSGPVAFHGVVNEAVPSVASSTPLTYSLICWLVASYTPARWVQTYGIGVYADRARMMVGLVVSVACRLNTQP